MRIVFLSALLLVTVGMQAQDLPDRLSTYFSFDQCDGFDDSGNGSAAALVGGPLCVCGVKDTALRLDGVDDAIFMVGPVADVFTTSDFSVSFFFKPKQPTGGSGAAQVILSKQSGCNFNHAFWVRYSYSQNAISSAIVENDSTLVTVSSKLDNDRCWQHIALVRNNTKYSLYVNGVLKDEKSSTKRIDLTANSNVKVSDPICPTDRPYTGDIDELQFYNKALNQDEINLVNLRPDNIINNDTLIYLGNSFDIGITQTCAQQFFWQPAAGVSDVTSPTPTITPTETTTYSLKFIHPDGCQALDKITVKVIDPDTLDCTKIFIPNAFTPNASPGRNDRFGVSNPFAVNDFISFEVFDRWGGRVFNAMSAQDTWDGTSQGKAMNPGLFLYRLRYRCKGEEKILSGTLTLLK
ncbi:MAG: gliding motility-associated C-terminal domain-containing protein [Lewinellaceae bacterium]|nr:gliding motility-associated C-terminal domain-containing protein [Lewinellaceae bacterium]